MRGNIVHCVHQLGSPRSPDSAVFFGCPASLGILCSLTLMLTFPCCRNGRKGASSSLSIQRMHSLIFIASSFSPSACFLDSPVLSPVPDTHAKHRKFPCSEHRVPQALVTPHFSTLCRRPGRLQGAGGLSRQHDGGAEFYHLN